MASPKRDDGARHSGWDRRGDPTKGGVDLSQGRFTIGDRKEGRCQRSLGRRRSGLQGARSFSHLACRSQMPRTKAHQEATPPADKAVTVTLTVTEALALSRVGDADLRVSEALGLKRALSKVRAAAAAR